MVCDIADFHPTTVQKAVSHYLPKELIPTDWTCYPGNDFLQTLLDESNGKLRVFLSGEDLFKEVIKCYSSFPRCMEEFGVDVRRQYKRYPVSYQSLYGKRDQGNNEKKPEYVYKYDLLCLLYTSINLSIETFEQKQFLMDGISFFLSHIDHKYQTISEMGLLPKEEMNNLAKTLGSIINCPENNSQEIMDVEVQDILYDMQMWSLKNEKDRQALREMIDTYSKQLPIEKFNRALKWIEFAVEWIGGFIEDHSKHFKPRVLEVKPSRPVVRLFTVKASKSWFVMVHELLRSMKQEGMDVSSFENEVVNMPKLATWDFINLTRKLGNESMKQIDFACVPVIGNWFKATPIPTIDGGHCILAADALLQLLDNMIIAKKVFQIIEKDQLTLMGTFFDSIQKHFHLSDQMYFIDLKDIGSIMNEWENFFELNFKNSRKPIRNVRFVRRPFTENDVKKEMENLGLNQVFPEILKYAEGVKGIITTQMVHAVIDAQYNCVFQTFPKFLSYFHHQKGCLRLERFECGLCLNKENVKKVENIEVKEESKSETAETIERTMANSETNSEASSESEESVSESESVEQKETITETPKLKEKKKKTKSAKKESDAKLETCPIEKESQTCPKCARASEYTRATNEKLRLERIEKKQLKKQLAEVEKMQQDDKEMIKRLEQKLLEQEQQFNVALQMKDEEIELLKNQLTDQESQIADVIKINEEKDEIINGLRTREPEVIPVTVEAIRPQEETEKVAAHLSKLLKVQETLETEEPVKKSTEIVETLTAKTNSKEIQQLAKTELKVYQLQCSFYATVLESNIKLIQGNKHLTLEQIPELVDFPEFSNEFKDVYKKTVKTNVPILCKSLLKSSTDLADPECLVCLVDVEAGEETIKCNICRRRYHDGCIKMWFQSKRSCPTCNSRMLDDEEFPALQ